MDASNKVFSICELAGAILNHLSLYELLVASTVCRNFLDTISTSSTLRQRLQNDPIPVFARLCPNRSDTVDLTNVNENTPWFFRTPVWYGIVITLRIVEQDTQLYVPNDTKWSISTIDSQRTKGAYYASALTCEGRVEWFDNAGTLVCAKDVLVSRFTIQKPDKIWNYLQTFKNEEWKRISREPETKARQAQGADQIHLFPNVTTYINLHGLRAFCSDTVKKTYDDADGWLTD